MTKRKQHKDVSSFFTKYVRRENGESSNPNTLPPEQIQAHSNQNEEHETEMGYKSKVENQLVVNEGRLTEVDVLNLPQDPGKRRQIRDFHKDDRDIVRREYCSRGPCQPKDFDFPFTVFGKKKRRFNPDWFDKYKFWIEYSVEKDAAFCLPCYLFKEDTIKQNAFVSDGFRTWSKPGAFEKHIGAHMSAHWKAAENLIAFKNQNGSGELIASTKDEEVSSRYLKRLEASIRCVKWLLLQGLLFHGHDEKICSSNEGHFIELLKFHGEGRSDLENFLLENDLANCELTSFLIQKDIVNACAKETTNSIIKEIGDDCFSIIVEDCVDICDEEQMALCLRYVSKNGRVVERFLGIVHVHETTSITLKSAIDALLMEHSLSISRVRGQGYDGSISMQDSIEGLKALISNECPSAHYVYCFSHQFQVTLVTLAKKNEHCSWFFDDVLPLLSNFLGGSPKRKEFLRQKQKDTVVDAFSLVELEFGNGLNQEQNLFRRADILLGSHFKIIKNVISLFRPTLESLDAIADSLPLEKNKACEIMGMLMTFDFIFLLHLMGTIFGIIKNLSLALQKKEQDIVNAMVMVDVVKKNLRNLRDNGWETHLNKVISFIEGFDIDVPNMEALYVNPGIGRRMVRSDVPQVTNLHHFRVEVFLNVLDLQLQGIENCFSEKSKDLLVCMSCFNPTNRFSSFNVPKLLQLAKLFPNEFSEDELYFFDHSLQGFVDDLRSDERFYDLKNLNELSMKLVETGKNETHADVYLLLKLVLLLPVAMPSVERVFSGMTLVKKVVRNSIGDQLLNDSLVTYLEKDMFLNVNLDVIVKRFQSMRTQHE